MGDIARIVVAAAFAGAIAACGVVEGLGSYSTCSESCDASADAGRVGHADATMDSSGTLVPPADGTLTDTSSDDDGAFDGGCAGGQIECADACVDPTTGLHCGACDNTCEGDAGLCAAMDDGSFGCTGACPASAPTPCGTSCVDTLTDSTNCGGCGVEFACAQGDTCVDGECAAPVAEAGTGADSGPDATSSGGHDAGPGMSDASVPCPSGGCPTSTVSGYSACSFGSCTGNTGSACPTGGGCFCVNDSQCLSRKCVKVTGENEVGCGSGNCTGTGSADGVSCELASPGIPVPAGVTSYTCPAGAGYHGTNLTCEASHTNCYCTADGQCPSGHCVSNATNNGSCSGAGPCTGTGTPDYRGCQAPSAPSGGCGFGQSCSGQCTGGIFGFGASCVCNNDNQCVSGKCAESCGSSCTGSGTAQSSGCDAPPNSVPCVSGNGGTACTTTLSPSPVLNSARTGCVCVADGDCSSGKCINSGQCTGTCTGTGTADSEGCATVSSVPNAWSCSVGNCDTITSPSGTCAAQGVPCWCTGDSQCPDGSTCAPWSGCASGACTGSTSATPNAFHCVL